ELLQGLSCVAHLLLILLRVNGTAFKTSQSYHDIQAIVQGMIFVVQQAKQIWPGEKMYLWQVGSDSLENPFAVVRTLTHSRNVDLKELGERLGAAVAMRRVYSDHDSWKRVSRRLNGTLDHMNTTTWDKGEAGNTDVRGVDLASVWESGCVDAMSVLQVHPVYGPDGFDISRESLRQLEREGVMMLWPYG
ncbi:unnamed protein product, partial [Sphacelaria rigidula]